MINNVFGSSIQNSFKSFDFISKNEDGIIGCSASNNGYEKNLDAYIKEKFILIRKKIT